jgi:hypothetical protein
MASAAPTDNELWCDDQSEGNDLLDDPHSMQDQENTMDLFALRAQKTPATPAPATPNSRTEETLRSQGDLQATPEKLQNQSQSDPDIPALQSNSSEHSTESCADPSLPSKTAHQSADATSKTPWGSHERLIDHILKNYPQLWEQYVRERRVKQNIPDFCQDSSQSPIIFVFYAARGFLRSLRVNPDAI